LLGLAGQVRKGQTIAYYENT